MAKEAAIIIARSRFSPRIFAAIGEMTAATPAISSTLAMFEPTTLPTAMSGDPFIAARSETRSSGIDVPNPMTRQPDQQRRQAEPVGERNRAAHQPLAAEEQEHEAGEESNDVECHARLPSVIV